MKNNFDIQEETKAVCYEILSYKWLESEKMGQDIGEDRAAQEWIRNYYECWFQSNASKFMEMDS